MLTEQVTWDKHSIYVHGERVLFYSGEYHPFRLPVPSLWKDVFQKLKSAGFNGVSFYTDWALYEGEQGVYREEEILNLSKFIQAAKEAGIYLLARPGPYINAEVSGGGFPGWLQRVKGTPRTREGGYMNATDTYIKNICKPIADGQITNGGPVILYQPENEYSQGDLAARDEEYMQLVEDQARDNGIVVPFINNDPSPSGYNAPGTGVGAVDIYGHDYYPFGFDCSNPYDWTTQNFPTDFYQLHEEQSPNTPYSLVEYQGGSFDRWGGAGFDNCAVLINSNACNLLYKDVASFGVAIQNLYMTFGGTNWGNLGMPEGYTSYDYGSAIKENRLITREKYSAEKLLAYFLQSTPDYLTAVPVDNATGTGYYTGNSDLFTSQSHDESSGMRLFFIRHTDPASYDKTQYTLEVPTSEGNITIPQSNSSQLTLNGRDAKIHVVDYPLGDKTVLYSTAEILTWKQSHGKTVVIVYGGEDEYHELAFKSDMDEPQIKEGSDVDFSKFDGHQVLSWTTSSERRIVSLGDVDVYILDRYAAYNYWEIPYTQNRWSDAPYSLSNSLIMQAGYLVRTARVSESTIALTGDLNATSTLEIIAGAPQHVHKITFNGERVTFTKTNLGTFKAQLKYNKPNVQIPNLLDLDWRSVDTMPEASDSYDDSRWTKADLEQTYNDEFNQTTPTSLSGSDYGYNTGSLIFRGHFTANGNESEFSVGTQGGYAFATTVFLNGTYIGAYAGTASGTDHVGTYSLPKLTRGENYVLTVYVDHMGLDMQWTIGQVSFKHIRGITNYTLAGRDASDISWKLTGNYGGEQYPDKERGPLNEGGFYAERMGYHLPKAPTWHWNKSSPAEGFSGPGARFYTTNFKLNLPRNYDIPLSFAFNEDFGNSSVYRSVLYVNGYQFGRYLSNIGPQYKFPVPEGILNYHGTNYIGLLVWAPEESNVKVSQFSLEAESIIQSGMETVSMSPTPAYSTRHGAY